MWSISIYKPTYYTPIQNRYDRPFNIQFPSKTPQWRTSTARVKVASKQCRTNRLSLHPFQSCLGGRGKEGNRELKTFKESTE